MRSSLLTGLFLATLCFTTPALAETKTATKTTEVKKTVTSAALANKTPFRADPYRALRCKFLNTLAGRPVASAQEYDLLNDANDGQIEHWSMAKATLVISGVEDPDMQKHYLARLKEIETECKKATANVKGTKKRAEVLGKFLLQGPLKAGYVSGQSDFIKTLNSGTFNCVSSAVMYNLMAPRVGISVRAVTISGHVFSRALDFDIEPTSGDVYSLDDRARRSLKNRTVVNSTIAPYQDQIYRETGNAGLLSSVYTNNGVEFDSKKQYALSVSCYLKAACLDPANPNNVYNLRVTFEHWIKDLKANHNNDLAASVESFQNTILRPYEETALKMASK